MLLFGKSGQFVTRTGEIKTVWFRNAFSEGISYDYLWWGAEKTGYIPNTRCLLKSSKLRHELFEDADDDNKTPHQIIVENFEQQNKKDYEFFLSPGYGLATNLRIPVEKVSKKEQEARKERICNTIPNTRDFREKIINIRRQAGTWFNTTRGGFFLNSDDPIIALEAENLLKKKGSLEKKKKDNENRRKQIQTGQTVLRNKGNNMDD